MPGIRKQEEHVLNRHGKTVHSFIQAGLIILTAFLFMTFCPMPGISSEAHAESSDTLTLSLDGTFYVEDARAMLDLINDLRANDAWYWNETDTEKVYEENLLPLQYDYALERVAMQRAAEVAVYYAHTRPNGSSCFTAFPSLFTYTGENLGAGTNLDKDTAFTGLAEADQPYAGQGHRRNMLDSDFTSVGIGCFEYNGFRYWAQALGYGTSRTAPSPLEAPVTIEVLKSRISSTSLNSISIFQGASVPLPDLLLTVSGTFPSDSTFRYAVEEENAQIADTAIASISDGTVHGLSVGETTLTVNQDALTASASVKVTADSVIPLSLGDTLTVDIPAGETVYFSFMPQETGRYVFSSSGSFDPVGYLYDSSMTELLSNDDVNTSNRNFALLSELTGGKLYYYAARMYSSTATGSVSLTLAVDPTKESGGFSYLPLDDTSASIVGCSLSGDIVIPEMLDGYTVTNLASRLFYGLSNVRSVTIPKTVTYFGSEPSDNDWDYVFSYCWDLENIHVDSDNPTFKSVDGVLYSKDGSRLINYPSKHPGEVYHTSTPLLCCTSFAYCENLKFLFLDNANTTWYTYTFYNDSSLTVFYREGGGTEQKIASDTTSPCTFVSTAQIAELPSDLERIEAEAFQNTDLLYVRIPDSCTSIQSGAFTGSALKYISVGSSTVIEDGAIGSSVIVDRR